MAIRLNWSRQDALTSRQYTCGYCSSDLASNLGFCATQRGASRLGGYIYICHFCDCPTFFDLGGRQYPAPAFGKEVKKLPPDIQVLYDEARRTALIAPTGSALCSRKLLMNIAVSKGAKEGLSFLEYVDFLSTRGYVPPDGKGWVDHIRTKGNEATHKIRVITPEEASGLIVFLEMLLKLVYEFPNSVPVTIPQVAR